MEKTGNGIAAGLVEIEEGATRVIVPAVESTGGPQTTRMEVFYNPVMAFNRHVSVVLFNLFHEGIRRALDGLAGSGIRACRLSVETPYEGEMVMNDLNPRAAALMEKNIALARERTAATLITEQRHLNALMYEQHFDYIDVDPFGSPIYYLDAAFASIRRDGIVAVTATDTGALAGKFPRPLFRRYGMVGGRIPCMHEIGVRSLMGVCARYAAVHEKSIHPILSHANNHYYRCYMKIEKGARKADAMLDNMGYVVFSEQEYSWDICPVQEFVGEVTKGEANTEKGIYGKGSKDEMNTERGIYGKGNKDEINTEGGIYEKGNKNEINTERGIYEKGNTERGMKEIRGKSNGKKDRTVIGPLWTGALHSPDTMSKLSGSFEEILDRANTGELPGNNTHSFPVRNLEKHFRLWSAECDLPPLFYHVDVLARKWKASSPNMNDLMEALRRRGFSAARTHFEDKGIKTDADVIEMKEAYREIGALRRGKS